MTQITTIAISSIAAIILIFVMIYNSLIRTKNRVENAWSQIDVQLKRRADLIPNLIKTVKGYVKHEKGVLTEVTKARTGMMKAHGVGDKAKAENQLTGALKTLFAVSENYPKLQANENFKLLQEELAGTESKIAYARQFYNDNVMSLNTKIDTIPTNIVAKLMKLKEEEYFETTDDEKKVVEVDF